MKKTLAALCLTLVLSVTPALAGPPATITYQGYLTNSSGVAVNAPVSMNLALYDAPTNGTLLWSETQLNVTVSKGAYTVLLGSVNSLINLPFDKTYYLGVTVGVDAEMSPRLVLSSVPTVFRAMSADKLNQACADGETLKYVVASSTWSCAATLTAGTAANNLIQLNGTSQLPAVDASRLTGVKISSFGSGNTAGGTNSLPTTTAGMSNTGFGSSALKNNTSGSENTASGSETLLNNTTGYSNTASGVKALYSNTVGYLNTASGHSALFSNTDGYQNTAYGINSLYSNTSGYSNTAYGPSSLYRNTTGASNTALGQATLNSNISGNKNTASGLQALALNTTGSENTSSGTFSMYSNTTGSYNIALGKYAGFNLTTGDYNINIGNGGVAAEANTIRIGDSNQAKTFIAGIRGVGSLSGTQSVVIDANGQLGSVASSSGTVTSVTASGVLSSSGGVTPAITLTGTIPVANGGTGATTLTGYVKGNGTSAMTTATTIPVADITGLGGAATLSAGTAVNNLVQMTDGPKLPAVDGSQLTSIKLLSDANYNVKAGTSALNANNIGLNNSAFGDSALVNNTNASLNTAIGYGALYWQDYDNSGVEYESSNVAIGPFSLFVNKPTASNNGIHNTAIGSRSLQNNTTGKQNIAIGSAAGVYLTTGDFNIDIGNVGVAGEGNTIRIGDNNQTKTFIAGIYSVAGGGLTTAKSVVIGSDGQLGTVASTSGTVTNVTVGTGLNISNGSTTPNITLGTVPVANGGTGSTDASGARTALGLGTSATLNVGTATGNIVQLDGPARLPSLDASQLTSVPAPWTGIITAATLVPIRNIKYLLVHATLPVAVTLPAAGTLSVGDCFRFMGGPNGFSVKSTDSTIYSVDVTVNTGATVTFTAKGATIELVYVAPNTFYVATNAFNTGTGY